MSWKHEHWAKYLISLFSKEEQPEIWKMHLLWINCSWKSMLWNRDWELVIPTVCGSTVDAYLQLYDDHVHSLRLGNWDDSLDLLKQLLPFFAAGGWRNYTKCVMWFISEKKQDEHCRPFTNLDSHCSTLLHIDEMIPDEMLFSWVGASGLNINLFVKNPWRFSTSSPSLLIRDFRRTLTEVWPILNE